MTIATVEGARVLITGGTGSFGQTMTAHLLTRDVEHVRILSRDEAKQHDMRVRVSDPRASFHVGDVRDSRSVERAVATMDLVFHAAALKQVPTAEFFPMQAMWTNVVGSANVIEASQKHGVASVVCLSTDKAVMPVNAMGMTKALMEKVAHAAARANDSATTVSTVRYGNVLYSRGSVVPLFVEQVLSGQAMTVTDPAMTRFLMPLRDAVALVEYAFTHAEPGDTFVKKSLAATVGDVAQAVASILGVEPQTKTIGVRHGEKLYETLATSEELSRATDLGDYYRIWMDDRDLNYDLYFELGDAPDMRPEEFNSHNAPRLDVKGVQDLLMTLPEVLHALDQGHSSL